MKFLQKLGKALMLPVAILPICGILMGIGYRLCPATMQGGDIKKECAEAHSHFEFFYNSSGSTCFPSLQILSRS